MDEKLTEGKLYYRIKRTMLDGSFNFSNIASINISNALSSIKLYPNPATGKNVQLQFNAIERGNYTIMMRTLDGKIVQEQKITHAGGSAVYPVTLPEHTLAGVYFVVVQSEKGEAKQNLPLLVE
jgi:hypothetical protein